MTEIPKRASKILKFVDLTKKLISFESKTPRDGEEYYSNTKMFRAIWFLFFFLSTRASRLISSRGQADERRVYNTSQQMLSLQKLQNWADSSATPRKKENFVIYQTT